MSGPGVVLVYHRVAEVQSDPWALAVTREHFSEHLDVLCSVMRPLSLAALTDGLSAGTIPDKAVVVTFDDGYADNLHLAKPLLEQRQVPASVFVVTGHLAEGRPFWWDVLEAILLGPCVVPPVLQLKVDGEDRRWELGDAVALDEAGSRAYRNWRAWTPPPTARHETYLSIWRLLRPLADPVRQALIQEIVAWAQVELSTLPRRMSAEELVQLGASGLVEVGAHTVTHPLLASLTSALQQAEVEENRAHLEEILDRSVTRLAYPYGSCNADTLAAVRRAGFTAACSAHAGGIDSASDLYQLPRVQVPDCSGEEFSGLVSNWLAGRYT